ncbi:MAG: hypothetical protein K0R02_297 [Rickettsiaceae bacterium]|jgi:hypothetical protein|nr:hypothetical protein [Rickettsiaceae bacterium]
MESINNKVINKSICRAKWLALITKLADSIDQEIDKLDQDKTNDNSKAKAALCNAVARIIPLVLKLSAPEAEDDQSISEEEEKMLYNYYTKYYTPKTYEHKK